MAKKKHLSKTPKKSFPWVKLIFTFSVIAFVAFIYTDIWLMHHFNGSKWQLPATIFARPLEVYEGKAIKQESLVSELTGAGYVRTEQSEPGTYSMFNDRIDIHLRPFAFWDREQPTLQVSIYFEGDYIASIQGLDPSMNGSFRLEPIKIGGFYPQQRENRLLVSIDEVPEALVHALLATEDRDFFHHHGISIKGIARAAWANIRHGSVVQGASTLTQQLVKNFFLSSNRTILRKVEEVFLSLMLELRATKKEILEAYINEVYIAQDGNVSIHGFGLASEFFFAKPLDQLSTGQLAMLVGMMKGPSYYNPVRHPERAKVRRDLVLSLMHEQGYLDENRLLKEKAKPLGLMVNPDPASSQNYAAYIQLVRQQLSRDYSKEDLQTQGLRIFTNMDPQLQSYSQKSLEDGLVRLKKRYGDKAASANGAIVVVKHTTGDVEALVGGKEFRAGSFNRALYADRPIGSLVKPAVYLTALQRGYRLSDLVSDEPLLLTVNNKEWAPKNYDRRSHYLSDIFKDIDLSDAKKGIPLYLAMAKSYNIATVRLGMDLGVNEVAQTLQLLGVDSEIPKVPSLFLGSLALTPIEVAQFYATLGGGGFYSSLNTIREVTGSRGKPLKRYKIKLEKRFEPDVMYLIDFAMQAVIHTGTAKSVASRFGSNRVIAGKSGTTNDMRDNWFAGYDTEKTTVVWLGNDDNKPLPMYASTGSLPIWADIMTHSLSASGAKPEPDNIEYHWVDIASDELTEEGCQSAAYIPFIKGTQPKLHTDCYINKPTNNWFKRWFQ